MLEHEDAEVFAMMVDWLYRGSLPDQIQHETKISLTTFMPTAKTPELIKLTALAERYQCARLADQGLEILIKRHVDEAWSSKVLSYVTDAYKLTTKYSKLRLFMSKVLARRILSAANIARPHSLEMGKALAQSEDLATDFVKLIRGKGGNMIEIPIVGGCAYHQHSGIERCPYAKS